MFKNASPLFLLTETPLHAGSGDDLGVVDLPIQRERHTSFPKIEASSLKGALREAFEAHFEEREKDLQIEAAFGPEDVGNEARAGALAFTDARLLCFPVKSVKGVFAWITCPRVLKKWAADMALCTLPLALPTLPTENTIPKGCNLLVNGSHVVLEEYAFQPTKDDEACRKLAEWLADHLFPAPEQAKPDPLEYWRSKLKTDLLVLSDNDFRDFVNLSTEVITRIKIDNEKGTAEDGALFTEEYLPTESILYSIVFASAEFQEETKHDKRKFKSGKETMAFFAKTLNATDKINNIFQLGGNATLGKGILRSKLLYNDEQ